MPARRGRRFACLRIPIHASGFAQVASTYPVPYLVLRDCRLGHAFAMPARHWMLPVPAQPAPAYPVPYIVRQSRRTRRDSAPLAHLGISRFRTTMHSHTHYRILCGEIPMIKRFRSHDSSSRRPSQYPKTQHRAISSSCAARQPGFITYPAHMRAATARIHLRQPRHRHIPPAFSALIHHLPDKLGDIPPQAKHPRPNLRGPTCAVHASRTPRTSAEFPHAQSTFVSMRWRNAAMS